MIVPDSSTFHAPLIAAGGTASLGPNWPAISYTQPLGFCLASLRAASSIRFAGSISSIGPHRVLDLGVIFAQVRFGSKADFTWSLAPPFCPRTSTSTPPSPKRHSSTAGPESALQPFCSAGKYFLHQSLLPIPKMLSQLKSYPSRPSPS